MSGGVRTSTAALARRVAPHLMTKVDDVRASRADAADLRTQVRRLEGRVSELEGEVQEARRLNRRIAELTDVVQELLLPVAQRDEARVSEVLERYGEGL